MEWIDGQCAEVQTREHRDRPLTLCGRVTLLQVAVCTPGRMIDLIKMKACTMRRTTFVVLDEADRMLDMGFEPQVRQPPADCNPSVTV